MAAAKDTRMWDTKESWRATGGMCGSVYHGRMRARYFLLRRAFFAVLPLLSLIGRGQAPPQPVHWTAEQDHANMMQQLGIFEL